MKTVEVARNRSEIIRRKKTLMDHRILTNQILANRILAKCQLNECLSTAALTAKKNRPEKTLTISSNC